MKIEEHSGTIEISGLKQRGAAQKYGEVYLTVSIDARKALISKTVNFYVEEYNPETNRTKVISYSFTREQWNQIKSAVENANGEL